MKRRGITLIEVLVIVAVILFLLALLLPAVQKVREAANRTATNNNLRQCAVAVHTANGDFKRLPPCLGVYGASTKPHSLYVHMFPYIEQGPAYQQGKTDILVPTYHAPSDPTEAGQATGTAFVSNRAIFDDTVSVKDGGRGREAQKDKQSPYPCSASLTTAMPDGTSNTIMFATGAIDCGGIRVYSEAKSAFITNSQPQWMWDFKSKSCTDTQPQPYNRHGLSVCLGDAVTRTVPPTCSAASWTYGMKTNDGRTPGADF